MKKVKINIPKYSYDFFFSLYDRLHREKCYTQVKTYELHVVNYKLKKYLTNKEALTVLSSVVKHTGSGSLHLV